MRDAHLTVESLQRFLEGEYSEEDDNAFLLHHLAVCPGCYAVGGDILDLYRAGTLDLGFSTIELDLARSRAQAPALLADLEPYPFDAQQEMVQHARQFRSWGLCELLAERSEAVAPDNPARAVELAELAVLLSSSLGEWEPAEETWLYELRALAWAYLASARRVIGNLRSAEEAVGRSDEWWKKGADDAGDVLGYEVRLLDLKASLRRDQRRFTESRQLLDQAITADRSASVRGRLLVKKAKTLEDAGLADEAITCLEEAEPWIDAGREPRLWLCQRFNVLVTLIHLERYEPARGRLAEVRRLTHALGNEIDLLRLQWMEGLINAGFGEVDRALESLETARKGFVAKEMGYDAALVMMDQVVIYAREGRTDEVKKLAQETVPLFQSRDVHREALAALLVFGQATKSDQVTVSLVERLAGYLRRARSQSALPLDSEV